MKEMNAEVKRGKSQAFHRSEEQEDCDDGARPDVDADEDQTSRWRREIEQFYRASLAGVGEGRDGRRRTGGRSKEANVQICQIHVRHVLR